MLQRFDRKREMLTGSDASSESMRMQEEEEEPAARSWQRRAGQSCRAKSKSC